MGLRRLALLGAAIVSAGVIAATTGPNAAWGRRTSSFNSRPGLSHRRLCPQTASRSPTASPTTSPLLNAARRRHPTASRSPSRNARPATPPTAAFECYERLKGHAPTGASLFQPAQHRHHLRAHRRRRRATRSR